MCEQTAFKAFIFYRDWRDKVLKYCKDDAQLAEFMRALWDWALDGKEYTGDNETFAILLEGMIRDIERQRANFENRGKYYNNNNNNNYKNKIRQQKNSFSSEVSEDDIEKFKRRINAE